MQATPGRDSRSYAEIQKYLQSDYTASSAKMDDESSSTMTRVLARLNRSQPVTEPPSATKESARTNRKLFTRRASATAEYTDLLQQRALSQLSLSNQEGASISNQSQGNAMDEEEVLRRYLGKRRGSKSHHQGNENDSNETLVKAGVLKDLRGKLATTEQKLRVVQSDLVTKCDEVRKLLAKVSRLEKEKSRALQSQIDALPKSDRKKAKASIWSKLEKDTKKRDARFSQILQHYEILEGQYNESVKTREDLETSLTRTRDELGRKEVENTTLKEECVSMTVSMQKSRLEFLECMKSLQDLKRSHELCQEDCSQMKSVIGAQEATIAKQSEELERLKKLQERTLKEKVRKDHKIGALQKKVKKMAQETDLLKKTQETYESDYYNLEDRMKVLRKRNSFLEVNLGKANKITNDAKKTVEMKEQECKLMASIINSSRAAPRAPAPGPAATTAPTRSPEPTFFSRGSFGGGAAPKREGDRTARSIEDELAHMDLVVSPSDSLEGGDHSDGSEDEE
ncbi:hypothetical protein HOP50_01g06600 [Chloropicon primus]|uniref:Uncharacterized protein n=1 Tax=Chloropicon primus TaxID=1764295 RepID=A0A5B8MCF1_9CHLO|nr:hypothetical protein A3770_01p06750 [Chloropicon primus]UPQ97369.1 hypothetical protein HOP50_01g06600 [Chloropicon primus]|eukprot:QDZ18157.1 hypothetical protein A3770_01p06750 [Chloropicon primus]